MHPRLEYVDITHEKQVLATLRAGLEKTRSLMKSDPNRLIQARFSSIARQSRMVAGALYGMGAPLADVHQAFRDSLEAKLHVYELRGTEEPFPVTKILIDPSKPKDDPNYATMSQMHSLGTRDYSIGHSWDGFTDACLAFGIGMDNMGREFANKIWDPPNARYVASNSVICTIDQQKLAYEFRDAIGGVKQPDVGALVRLGNSPSSQVRHSARMIRALLAMNRHEFLTVLSEFLAWHHQEARRKQNRISSEFFICIPALGLTELAIKRKLVTNTDLSRNEPHLPVAMYCSGS